MHNEEMKKPDLTELCQIEKDLVSTLRTVVSQGVFSKEVDGKELGELVDMVKDIAETKRNCWEAHYYETVSKAMEEYEGDPYEVIEHFEDYPMGYNRNRYKSGRYAPMGTGNRTVAGYTPFDKRPMFQEGNDPMRPGDIIYGEDMMPMMGYNGNRDGRARNMDSRDQYGSAFREYEDARRHYTETKSLEDKNHMDEKAMEHVDRSMMTLREIWKNADPAVKKEVASSISSLASEFKSV